MGSAFEVVMRWKPRCADGCGYTPSLVEWLLTCDCWLSTLKLGILFSCVIDWAVININSGYLFEDQHLEDILYSLSLWSGGLSYWLQIQRTHVRFPVQPDILRRMDLERRTLSIVRIFEEILAWKAAAPVYKTEINDHENPLRRPRGTRLPAKVGTNFADKWRPLGRHCSLAE
jgi:hypothetical protein